MKRLILMLFFLFIGIAEAKSGHTKLLQPLSLLDGEKTKTVEAEIFPLLKSKTKAKDAKLIGKVNITKRHDKVITQFVFGGIETKNPKNKNKRQVVLFKKPIIGSGICGEGAISPEDLITLQYTEEELQEALENLLKEQNLATKPKKFKASNPTGELTEDGSSQLVKTDKKKDGAFSDGLRSAEEGVTAGEQIARTATTSAADPLHQEPTATDREEGAATRSGTTGSSRGYNPRAELGRGAGFPTRPDGVGSGLPGIVGEQQHREAEAARRDGAARREEVVPTAHIPAEIQRLEVPNVEVRTTSEGCHPRIDRVHNKVIIQEKTITSQDGRVIETSACEDTLEQYDIYKDFLCEGCTPFVDGGRRLAFDKYKAFWINGDNHNQVLDEEPQTDLTNPHPFFDEEHGCGFDIEDLLGMAYPRVATVFADRFNGKHVVEACHRLAAAPGYRIEERDCPMEHDFAGNRTYLRKKKVFDVDGVEHLAHDCARTGAPIPHEFITSACQPIVDPTTGTITPLARRRIRLAAGNQFITECEPLADTNLQATTDGCEDDLFSHDFVSGRSYFNKRYYYTGPTGARVYCTPCVRSAEAVAHEYDEAGFQHDDGRHISLRKMATFIAFRLLNIPQRQQIAEPAVRSGAESVAHVLVRTENRASGPGVYQGCHRVTQSQIIQHYNRPDGSTYEVIEGLGVPVQGPNECRINFNITGSQHEEWYEGNGTTHFTLRVQVHRVYPDGRSELVNSETLQDPSTTGATLINSSNSTWRYTYTYTCRVTGITKRFYMDFTGLGGAQAVFY